MLFFGSLTRSTTRSGYTGLILRLSVQLLLNNALVACHPHSSRPRSGDFYPQRASLLLQSWERILLGMLLLRRIPRIALLNCFQQLHWTFTEFGSFGRISWTRRNSKRCCPPLRTWLPRSDFLLTRSLSPPASVSTLNFSCYQFLCQITLPQPMSLPILNDTTHIRANWLLLETLNENTDACLLFMNVLSDKSILLNLTKGGNVKSHLLHSTRSRKSRISAQIL